MFPLEDDLVPRRSPARQTISVFSLIGGTGRTSIAAGLARMLAGSGLRVLLVDTCAYSLLPRLFGGGDARQGVMRRFVPVTGARNQTVSVLSLAIEIFAGDDIEQYRILREFSREAEGIDRIIWDLGGAPLDWVAKVLRVSTQILVPLLPNMQSLMQLRATESFLAQCGEGRSALSWRYLMNRFEERNPVHHDLRNRFRQLLGEQLLPGTVRSSALVDEALAKGKTVFDHAPASLLASDMWRLADHLNETELHAMCQLPPPVPSEWCEES